jgi:hypothetical protein
VADPDRACHHHNFAASVAVNRIAEDGQAPTGYVADIRVACADCDEPFRFSDAPAGLSFAHPAVSVDETELHAPIRPASSDPDFGLGLPGFAVRYRDGGDLG